MGSNSNSLLNIISFDGKSPQFDETVFIDPTARLIGEVVLGSEVSIYPFALLRADSHSITVRERSVILDKVLIEAPKDHPVVIEKEALISHGAILHGCIVREGAIVGIGAIVLDGAEVGRNSIVGSGSLVPPKMKIPDRSLVLGIPAKVARTLDDEDLERSKEQLNEAHEKSRKYLKIFGSN
ncbi:MAG: gamma carbonic anhydrase family protein [Thermodesulfobacteriota bacterium]|nr:gamma carbonic anhydrase family protein [Thermodesulfobacteriota bacterium]